MTKDKNFLLENLRKERDLFARYSRSHPRFKKNILLDALVSIVIVVLGFAAVNQISERTRIETLTKSGGIAMAPGELVQHVKRENIKAYWFGPIPGYKYSIICKDRREIIVTYLPQGVSLNHPDRFNLTIETYSKSLLSESKTLSNLSTDKDDFLASNGTAATVYSERPVMVSFAIPNTDSRVEVQYPSGQRIYDVYSDAEQLKLISKL